MYRRLARFNRKAPTGVKPPYVIFNPHSLPPCIGESSDQIVITAIDPGIKNCGMRTSIYTMSTQLSQTLQMCNINFTAEGFHPVAAAGTSGMETQYYTAIFLAFEPYLQYFLNSQYICVESQLPINYDLVRMGQHITTYLMTVIRNKGCRPLIVELDPHTKTRMLNAPPKMTKPQIKAWCRLAAIHFLKVNGEPHIAEFLEKQRKGDDMGDVVCYEKCMILILLQGVCRLDLPTIIAPPLPPPRKSRVICIDSTPSTKQQVINPFS